MLVHIFDKLSLGTKREYSDEGFMTVPANISRTGIQEYLARELGLTDRPPNEIIKVYRPPNEVFKAESMASFENKVVTDNHPPELVESTNVSKYAVGHTVGKVVQDGMFLTATLHITDQKAIDRIESGKVELSNGYVADIDMEDGISEEGEQYDAVQRNILGNHIAIVNQGRAGHSCRLADSSPTKEDKPKMIILIDGAQVEVSDGDALVIQKREQRYQAEAKKLKDDLHSKEEELDDQEEENEKMKAKVDDAESKVLSDADIDKLVADRVAFHAQVQKVSPGYVTDGKSVLDVKRDIVTKVAKVDLKDKSDAYVEARFDMLNEAKNTASNSSILDSALESSVNLVTDAGTAVRLSDTARNKMIANNKDRWTKKIGVQA